MYIKVHNRYKFWLYFMCSLNSRCYSEVPNNRPPLPPLLNFWIFCQCFLCFFRNTQKIKERSSILEPTVPSSLTCPNAYNALGNISYRLLNIVVWDSKSVTPLGWLLFSQKFHPRCLRWEIDGEMSDWRHLTPQPKISPYLVHIFLTIRLPPTKSNKF